MKKFKRVVFSLVDYAKDYYLLDESKDANLSPAVLLEEFLASLSMDAPELNIQSVDEDKNSKRSSNKQNATNLNRVTISTIHKAKGCEWPVVFVPHFNDGFLPSRKAQEDQCSNSNNSSTGSRLPRSQGPGTRGGGPRFMPRADELDAHFAEECRLFHVAVTRAQRRCYVLWLQYFFQGPDAKRFFRSGIEMGSDSNFVREERWRKRFKISTNNNLSMSKFIWHRWVVEYGVAEEEGDNFQNRSSSSNNFNKSESNLKFNFPGPGPGPPKFSNFSPPIDDTLLVRSPPEQRSLKAALRPLSLPLQVQDFTGFLMLPDESELQRAYRKMSLKLHPDKGGDKDKFQEMKKGYDEVVEFVNKRREEKKKEVG